MKKRLLSFLLAAMMVVSIFVMPTSAATLPNDYSYKFLDTDIRNYADGQVIDLGYLGEAKTAPKVDGAIGEGEYTVETIIKRQSNAKAHASLPVHLAVKDTYLYVAVEYAGETKRSTIQWDLTVLSGHESYHAYSRLNCDSRSNGTITGTGSTFSAVNTATDAFASGRNSYYQNKLLLEHAWQTGVYEAKFDLEFLYRMFGYSVQCANVWETPVIGLFFFYDVSNETTVGQSQYAFPVSSVRINDVAGKGRTVGWVPKTIILPQSVLDRISENRDYIDDLGFDARNAVETQLAKLNTTIDAAPTQDGTVNKDEYTLTHVHKQNLHKYYGDLTAHYAVKGGMLYAAFQYEDALDQNIILQFGLSGASLPTAVCRTGYNIKTDGSFSRQNYLYKYSLAPDSWIPETLGGAGEANVIVALRSAAHSNVDGVTTIEISASIPALVASFEDTGWDADMTNAISFMLYPDLSTDFDGNGKADQTTLSYNISAAGSTGSAISTQIKQSTGLSYGVSCVEPTLELPDKYIRQYTINNVDDLEAYGQIHLQAKPNKAVLDGKISANEYTASQSYTQIRSGDGVVVPDLDVSGTNYFTHDGEYIYVGAEVYDPYYISGKSYYQFNIAVPQDNVPFDMGYGVTRLNSAWHVYSDGTTNKPTVGGVLRTQACNGNVAYVDDPATEDVNESLGNDGKTRYYVGQDDWLAKAKAAIGTIDLAGSYNEETGIVTYEAKIPIAGLKTAFNVDTVDRFTFINHVRVGTSEGKTIEGWNLFKTTKPADCIMNALAAKTQSENDGASAYLTNDFFQHVVHIDTDYYTKETASVRLSTTISGLRFKTLYTNEYLAYMQKVAAARGETMEIGTLIAPADFITDGEFTHAALGEGKYVEVAAIQSAPFSNVGGVTTFAGSLVNIKESNLGRDFAGRGFIKIGNEYFYSETYAVKSVSDVASAALADTVATEQPGYRHKVSEGVWSPYNDGQRSVLQNLVA